MKLKAVWGSNLTELADNLNHHNVTHVIYVENNGCGYEALVEYWDFGEQDEIEIWKGDNE